MYIALFATPWLTMYALSTIVFNHAAQVDRLYKRIYGPKSNEYVIEKRLSYEKILPENSTLRMKAEQLLTDLNLSGSFGVEKADDRLIIMRRDPFIPRRITFYLSTHRVVIERQSSRLASFLTTLHTQVSYTNSLKRIKAWAFSVDLTVATMLMLVISGVWMWWELKVTRFTGALFTFGGVILFCAFLFFA